MKEGIRPFNKNDWEEVKEIYLQTNDANSATFGIDQPEFEAWDEHYLPFCRLVYESDGKVLGWAAISPISGRLIYKGVAELSIYIDKDSRGRGIGTNLLKRIIWDSESHGIWSLQSSISEENSASIALHHKCGFREIGYRERVSRDAVGEWKDTILMERRSGAEPYAETGNGIL